MTRDEHFAGFDDAEDPDAAQAPRSKHAVSYTHLTLPTNREV